MAHPSKTGFGREPNRLTQLLVCGGINNKQDSSTLDLKTGDCIDIVNIDLANTATTREGYILDVYPSEYVAISNQYKTCINGRWYSNTDIGTEVTSVLNKEYKLIMASSPTALLEFYNGCLYSLVNNNGTCTLYCSDPWNIHVMDERYCVVATFDSIGTAIGRTDDGLFIGTDREIYFLKGSRGDFSQKLLARYGAIKNTLARSTGDKVSCSGMQGLVCLVTTKNGICVIGASGTIKNLSIEKFSYDWSSTAAAFVRERSGQVHYVVSMKNAINAYNKEIDISTIQDSI